jgi:alkanesulfonate monooxygenase SsuD/methylene tetrahydromethanopterin reductase-like flavin-dependent oxidoreductase (luciferase family)
MSPEHYSVFAGPAEAGFAEAGGGKSLSSFDIAPFVTVQLGNDLDACRLPVKQQIALYVGGMGAKDKNFYNDYVSAIGYPDAAAKIQKLFLSGKQAEAVAAVPDALVDALALVGPKERIIEQLAAWQEAGKKGEVGTLLAGGASKEALEVLAEAVL